MHRSTRAVYLAVLLCACGGGAQESPHTQTEAQPQIAVMKDGKSAWPPVGPGCEQLVACCKDASTGRPDIDLACQISAAVPDCPTGRKAVVELLDSDGSAVPASCR